MKRQDALSPKEREFVEEYRQLLWGGNFAPRTHQLLALVDRLAPPLPKPTDAELATKVALVMGVQKPGSCAEMVLEQVYDALVARSK